MRDRTGAPAGNDVSRFNGDLPIEGNIGFNNEINAKPSAPWKNSREYDLLPLGFGGNANGVKPPQIQRKGLE